MKIIQDEQLKSPSAEGSLPERLDLSGFSRVVRWRGGRDNNYAHESDSDRAARGQSTNEGCCEQASVCCCLLLLLLLCCCCAAESKRRDACILKSY